MKKEKNKEDNKVRYGTISLPLPLIKLIKEKIKGTGMNSVSAYTAYVLRQVLSYSEEDKKEFLDKNTEEEVKKRMKNLGYL